MRLSRESARVRSVVLGPGVAVRRRVLAAGVLVVAVALGGCAAGDGAEGSTPTGSVAASGTTSASATAVASTVPEGVFDGVVALVVERLDTGDAVAAAKYFSGAPVTDAAREQAVLDAAAARAGEVGADADYVATVFGDQIAASKEVQQQLLDAWAAGAAAPPASAPDLATEVRPILDRITAELVPALAAAQQYRTDAGCADALATALAAATPPAGEAGRAALPTATAHLCA